MPATLTPNTIQAVARNAVGFLQRIHLAPAEIEAFMTTAGVLGDIAAGRITVSVQATTERAEPPAA